MSIHWRLLGLAAGHIMLAIMARMLTSFAFSGDLALVYIALAPLPLCSLTLCQAVLLALWVAMSGGPLWGRMAGLIAGTVYLEALVPPRVRQGFGGTDTATLILAMAVLLVARGRGGRLIRFAQSAHPTRPEPERFRFSIQALMLVIAAVALLIARVAALRGALSSSVLMMAVQAVCYVAMGLVVLWATLGQGPLLERGLVVFLLAPDLGAFVGIAAQARPVAWITLAVMMLMYAATLFGSLLIVRSSGYRFVRPATTFPDPPESGTAEFAPE